MPDLRAGEYEWEPNEQKPWEKDPSLKAEGKPGHRKLETYDLPRWVFHPELHYDGSKYNKIVKIAKEDYAGASFSNPNGNREKWNVAHIAAAHNDMKLFLLATQEEMSTPTIFGQLPAHFASVGGTYGHPCLEVLYALVEAGADVESKNMYGRTPLQNAEDNLHKEDIQAVAKVLKGNKPKDYDELVEEAKTLWTSSHAARKARGESIADKAAPAAAVKSGGGGSKQPPLPVGLLFPGQGSQYVKMMEEVKDHPVVKKMLDEANKTLGYNLTDIMLKGPESKLEETQYCQPAMYVAGLAALAKLRDMDKDKVERCKAVAGLSLGEYSALAAAEVFTFTEGLKLVKLRGEAMQEAAKAGKEQAMLSVAGLTQEQLEPLCKKVRSGSEVCQIANFLFPKGFSVAGHKTCLEKLEPEAKKAGALQAKLLKTSGAFHTSLMQPAQVKLEKALKELEPKMKPPKCDIYMNVTGKVLKAGSPPKEIVKMLTEQLTSCVQWEPSMKGMISDGITDFYELGPMKQLKAMMKRIDNTAWTGMDNISV